MPCLGSGGVGGGGGCFRGGGPFPLLAEAALWASPRRASALTRSRLRRPEQLAGHTVSDQRVKALGLDALRGGWRVPAPRAPRPSPHAADAAAPPAGSESPPLPHGEETGRGHRPLPQAPPSCQLGWDALSRPQGPLPQTFSFYLWFLPSTTQPSPRSQPMGGPSAGHWDRVGARPSACSWVAEDGPPSQHTDLWVPSSVLLPKASPQPQEIPTSHFPHPPPPLGSPLALLRKSRLSSSNTYRMSTLDASEGLRPWGW